MFMRNNRAKNGVPQPETVGAAATALQRKARKLSPNLALEGNPEDWRFSVDLSTCEKINDGHYDAGISDEPFRTEYESKIPFVGYPNTLAQKSFRDQ
jgi:hypothetical protein